MKISSEILSQCLEKQEIPVEDKKNKNYILCLDSESNLKIEFGFSLLNIQKTRLYLIKENNKFPN